MRQVGESANRQISKSANRQVDQSTDSLPFTVQGDLDLLAVGETLVDLISVEETDSLRNAYTFRKYQGGSPANIAVCVAKLGGTSAVVSKTGIGAFGQFLNR